MLKVSRAALNEVGARGLHVDPQQEVQEGSFEVAVYARVVDHPQQFLHRHNGLAQRLDEFIFALKQS
jgi:hypothetical protein